MARVLVRRRGLTITEIVVVCLIIVVLIALLLPAVQQAREAARRTQWRNNLKQLGLALHNYHDTFLMFPPGGVIGADGTAFHGWFTAVTPYLDCSPFYNSIDFNIPWDDPRQIERFMRGSYHSVTMDPSFPGTPEWNDFRKRPNQLWPMHFAGNSWILYRNSSVRIDQLTTGTSSTLLAADAYDHFAPFGYPFNWRNVALGFKQSPEGFGNRVRSVVHLLMADGSVAVVDAGISPALVAAWSGPPNLMPSYDRTSRPEGAYQLASPHYWRTVNLWIDRGEKTAATLKIEPDGEVADVLYGQMEEVCGWPPTGDFASRASIDCSSVRRIRLSGAIDSQVIAQMAALPNLDDLNITVNPGALRPELLYALLKITSLESLTIREGWIGAEDVAQLLQSRHLKTLTFDWSLTLPTWKPAAILALRKILQGVDVGCVWQGQAVTEDELIGLTDVGKTLADLPAWRRSVEDKAAANDE